MRVKGPPRKAFEISCRGCGFVLEYIPADVRKYIPDPDLGDTSEDAYDYIICPRPECRKTTILPKPSDYP